MEVREAFRCGHSREGRSEKQATKGTEHREEPERPEIGVRQGQGREATGPSGDSLGWLFDHTDHSSGVRVPAAEIQVQGVAGGWRCVHAHM